MGLLDGGLLGGGASGGLDFTDPRIALAAGLLRGTGNLGANLSVGLLGANAAAQAKNQFALTQQAAERANRANDLQQVNGLYQTLQMKDAMQAIQDKRAGIDHIPDPALGQLQQKMLELSGLPTLSGNGLLGNPGAGSQMPQGMTPAPMRSMPSPGVTPAPIASQYSPVVRPEFQAQGPMPQGGMQTAQMLTRQPGSPSPAIPGMPTETPSQSNGGQPQSDPFGDLRDEADMFALMARKPELMAENRYKMSLPLASHGQIIDPRNGTLMGGVIGNVPMQRAPDGSLRAIPNDINAQLAARAGGIAGAQSAATSPFKTVPQVDASGATRQMFLPQLPGYPGVAPGFPGTPGAALRSPQPAPNSSSPFIPPEVLAADRSGSPFVATQRPGGPVQFQQPPQGANAKEPDPWATMPKLQIPQGLGQSTYAHSISEKQAETAGKLSDELGTQASQASSRVATNNQALELVDKADTGFLAQHIGDFRNILATIAPAGSPLAKSAADQAATDQVLGKDLVNTALQRGKQLFGSRFTQSEVGIMLSRAAPSPEMQKVAIRFLLESDNALQNYSVKQSDDLGRYLNEGGDPMRFKGWYATAFPVTKTLSQVHLNVNGAQSPLPANSVQLPNGKVYNFPSVQAAAQFRQHIGAK